LQTELIEQFIQYSKKEFYQWLVISMIHPSNQKFGIRYELLIHTLISINEKKFLNNKLTREKFAKFISWFEQKYSSHFVMMEDFEPFSQKKLIPLFLDGKKYYFFYGAMERPYEYIKQFYDIIFSVEIKEIENIKSEFLSSLKRQTDILTKLANDEEFKYETSQMYVPSLEFFNEYKSFFEMQNINEKYIHNPYQLPPLSEIEKMYDFGIDKEIDTTNIPKLDIDLDDSIYFYEMGVNNFNGLYTNIKNEYFYLPFETHIETIYTLAENIIYSNQFQSSHILTDSMHKRMMKMLSCFFTPPHRLDGIMDMSNNIYSKYFDTLAQVDVDKVVLFKFVSHPNNLQDTIDDIAKQLYVELEKMKLSTHELFMFRFDRKKDMLKINQVPIKVSEIKVIIIFEKVTLNYILQFTDNWKEKNIFIYNSLDIKPILELLSEKESDNNIALWQYLEAEKKQSLFNNNLMQMDMLDSFAIYYENESFAIMGKQPDLMMFVPHSWSNFYHEYLYKKYQDNIYELVESDFPNKFNKIIHLGNSTYECIDTSMLEGGRCVKYHNKVIWIFYPPNGFTLTEEEIRISMFIAEFLSFYIDRYKESIFKFLKEFNFDITIQDFTISIFPESIVEHNKDLKHLLPYINILNEDRNIIFYSYIRNVYNDISTAVIITSKLEKLKNTFGYNDSFNPEKYIFQIFIESLLKALRIQNQQNLVSKFIEKIWDIEERAFVLESRPVNNVRLEFYQKPLLFQKSFIANVNQEIVDYLKELQITPTEYWGDDAKQLNNLIFEFLQKKLEEIIRQFDSSILIYAYKQIEYIEGKREKEKKQMEFDVEKYIEFNIDERYYKQKIETSELAISAKHILHTILKVAPKGSKRISEQDWYYLMACSKIINETILRSDQLHYNLAETGIEITDSYELKDIDKSFDIDFNAHYKQTTSSQIISAKNKSTITELSEENKNRIISSPFDERLNSAWNKEYGFYLENMIKVMMALGQYEIKRDSYFPLSFLSLEEIINHLSNILRNTVSVDEVKKILNFLSLDFSTFKDYKYIDYSIDRLMRKKERLNLSPFIKIDDKYLFGHQLLLNAIDAWTFPLIEGDIPFNIDNKSIIKKELIKIHRKLDLELENISYEIAKNTLAKEFVRKTIKNFKQLSKNFQKQPPCGEIDLLIANPKTKTLFVMDAKNINKKFFTSAIKRELRDFFEGRNKKKSYFEKLNMKVDFIRENIDEILNHFKIINKNGWKIKKGFIVNTLYMSAFYKEKVDFILIDDLAKFLQQDENL
jgi:hypothetical protein